MIHDDVPLDGIAAAFGYTSQAAYTRAFTRQFGLPPRRYVATILGVTQADYAASNLGPVGGMNQAVRLLTNAPRLTERSNRPALARRFFGHDIAAHWHRFLTELPPGLADRGNLAGMVYDNLRVTPAHHWRFDCAIVFDEPVTAPLDFARLTGLDPVEVPGGTHAEVDINGDWPEMWRASVGLLSEWLPAHREFEPEGDPVVHWLPKAPVVPFRGTATIRIRQRGSPPAYNMRPLDRRGRLAGRRTLPTEV